MTLPYSTASQDFYFNVVILHRCEGTSVYSDSTQITDMQFLVDAGTGAASSGASQSFQLKNSVSDDEEFDSEFCLDYTCSLSMADGSSLPSLVSTSLSVDPISTHNNIW